MNGVTVAAGPAADTHDVRRRVLRSGTPSTDVTFPGDDDATTVHLIARDSTARTVGVASLYRRPCPARPGAPAVQLRGMAVEPGLQGTGVGHAVLARAVEHTRTAGARVLWANARDTALAFYEHSGFVVTGAGFVSADTGLPHHLVVLDLDET